jgi:hypothetical protein
MFNRVYEEWETNMTDSSPIPQDPQPSAEVASLLTGLLEAEYVCPICNATVIKIAGNELQYSESHVTFESNADGLVSLLMFHRPDGTEFVPARAIRQPFLVIKSSIITSA